MTAVPHSMPRSSGLFADLVRVSRAPERLRAPVGSLRFFDLPAIAPPTPNAKRPYASVRIRRCRTLGPVSHEKKT